MLDNVANVAPLIAARLLIELELRARSVGAPLSIFTVRPDEAGEVLPAASVALTVIECVPDASVEVAML